MSLLLSLPGFEGRRMYPIGALRIFFGEATAVGMSTKNSDHDYNYKTDFEIWRGNQEFERQKISMIWPPLDSTPIGPNTKTQKRQILNRLLLVQKFQTPTP